MDLGKLMNDDEASEESVDGKQSTSAIAQPSTPSHYGPPSQQQTPLYAPPAGGAISARPTQRQGMTPLRTPSQTIPSAQYPFPHQTQQSPISAAPGQSYRPFESQPLASSARPGSHGHAYQTSQPAPYTAQTPLQQQSSYASISPTPPSHLSRTPSSLRQSPMATMSHVPAAQQHPHYSQPNTPLGPPQHYPQRAPTYPETQQSPYHQRSFSNASNGLISGSPAQHHPRIPNLVESPSAYARPPNNAGSRQPSEYIGQGQRTSRERSISVSPKTKPPARPPSLGSRQSSSQEVMQTGRGSDQCDAPLAGSLSHVTSQPPRAHPHSHLTVASHPNAANDVTPGTSLQQAPGMIAPPAQSSLSSQVGNHVPQPQPPTTISHQNEKMGMGHLVTPASEVPPNVNGHAASYSTSSAKSSMEGVNVFMKERSATPKNHTPQALPSSTVQRSDDSPAEPQKVQPNGTVSATATMDAGEKPSLKRPAPSASSLEIEQRPSKQPKTEPTTSTSPETSFQEGPAKRERKPRPLWAQLSKHNPRYHEQRPQDILPSKPADPDLQRIRRVVRTDWEYSYTGVKPLAPANKFLYDWIWTQLAPLRGLESHAHVEIEAKLGTLFHKDSGERMRLPILWATALDGSQREHYRFESRMREHEHAHMNRHLNEATRASLKDNGRAGIRYEHFTDIDSFQPLSEAGLNALPQVVRDRAAKGRGPPRLRTTERQRKGGQPQVAARIVKMKIADLDVHSPQNPYDLRISVNVEVDLMRHRLLDDLVVPAKETEPARRKDRVSYHHLECQVDLTRVDIVSGGNVAKGQKPMYELEVEVNTDVLFAQMGRAERGEETAFGDVLEGFWDNCMYLMKERAE